MSAAAIRLFAAVPVDRHIRRILEQAAGKLRAGSSFHKWAHPADYHITLKFLGDTSLDRADQVKEALAAAAAGRRPFLLELRQIGVFGPSSAPSILWAGVAGDTDALRLVQQGAEQELAKHGFAAEDRPYRPHITLARRYTGSVPFQREHLPEIELNGTWTADRIVLYRSHLGNSPMYEEIESFALDGGGQANGQA